MRRRGSSSDQKAGAQWEAFLASHAGALATAGIDPQNLRDPDVWVDLLCLGYVPGSNAVPPLESLSAIQYEALLTMVDSYFTVGYEYFTPLALRARDRDWLRSRHER